VDPHHFGNPDPNPHPHRIKIRIRIPIRIHIKVIKKLDPNPHHFADDKPKRMEYEPIWALFQGFEPLFGS
jgi:hypothetical protein